MLNLIPFVKPNAPFVRFEVRLVKLKKMAELMPLHLHIN